MGHTTGVMPIPGIPACTGLGGAGVLYSVLRQLWPHCREKPHMGSGDVYDTHMDV